MSLPKPTRAELVATVRLAAPMVVVQVGWQLMGVVDSLMVGRISPAALAAVAIGNFTFFNVLVFGFGLIFVLDPIVAQAVGAGDDEGVALGVQRGVIIATAASGIIAAALWPSGWLLAQLRQPPEVIPLAAAWIRWSILGVLPLLLFTTGRQALQAMGHVRAVIVATIAANLLNAGLNWVLIFGHLGFPALGVVGSAHSTWISRWCMLGILVWVARRDLHRALVPWRPAAWRIDPLRRMTLLGLPLAVQFFFESFAFGLITIWAGWIGTGTLAGHEIALNLASLTFMVPLGVAGAGAALVGRAIGRGDQEGVRREAAAVLVIGVGFMGASALVFVLWPQWLAGLYTTDAATLAVGIALIPIAGAFQLFDGLQVVAGGILRGTGDTRVPMMMHFLGFWGVGIPVSYWLGLHTSLGARGLWWGTVAGLAAAGALQMGRVIVRLRGPLARVSVDDRVMH